MQGKSFKKVTKGFTLIELLVVIAIIALLMAVVLPGLSKAKEAATKVICANQQKQIGESLMMYAEQNNDSLALNYKASWLWDVSYLTTDFVLNTGGDRRTLYCPLDKTKQPDMMNFWRYSEGARPDDTESSLVPEPTTNRGSYYRVTGYFWLLARKSTPPMYAGREFVFPGKYTQMRNSSAQELVTDAVLSDTPDPRTCSFSEIKGGTFKKWRIYDRSNHLGRDLKVKDSNILFGDGHVDRRKFQRMQIWVGDGSKMPYHWW